MSGSAIVKKKVVRSAIALIPPLSVWDSIQDIRRVHDKSFVRWMPHVNIIYPFAIDSEFDTLAPQAIDALKGIAPFEVTLDKFEYFQHGAKSATLWLQPDEDNNESSLQKIETALVKAFPSCTDLISRSEAGYVPHLSVGQFKGKNLVEKHQKQFQVTWKPITFTVDCIYFISRTDADPFEVRKIIPLGGGTANSCFTEHAITTPAPRPGEFKLFIGGLSSNVTAEHIKEIFGHYCDVHTVILPKDNRTNKRKPFGFVQATGSMDRAIAQLHNATIDGKKVSVRKAV